MKSRGDCVETWISKKLNKSEQRYTNYTRAGLFDSQLLIRPYFLKKERQPIILERSLRFFSFLSNNKLGANEPILYATGRQNKSLLTACIELQLSLHVEAFLWQLSDLHKNLQKMC